MKTVNGAKHNAAFEFMNKMASLKGLRLNTMNIN